MMINEDFLMGYGAGKSAGGGGGSTLITKTITENGTYSAEDDDADGYSEVKVDVPSGGYSAKEFLYKQAPVGDVTIIADADIPTNNAFSGRPSNLTHLTIDLGSYKLAKSNGNGYQFQSNDIPVVTLISNNDTYAVPAYTFTSNSSPFTITMRGKWNGMENNAFRNNSGLTILDYTYTGSGSIGQNAFYGDSNFGTFIIRSDHVLPLSNTNAFSNSTPFRSGGAGGTLYVPQSLIASYQSASNWSTILGYANNQIKSIESTHTDPTAPIDLTLYYADGTPIS